MNLEIVAKSEDWKCALATTCQQVLSPSLNVGNLSVLEQLKEILNDDNCSMGDEELFKKLKVDYDLQVVMPCRDLCYVSAVTANTYRLCNAIYKHIPDNMQDGINYGKFLDKYLELFRQRGEQAICQVFRNMCSSIIEVVVRTDEFQYEELLCWNKSKIYIISFVPEFDEEQVAVLTDDIVFI